MTGLNMKLALERSAEFFNLSDDNRCLVSTKIYDYDIWSGIHYTIDISKPHGERIIDLTLNGEPILDKGRYKVAMYHFRSGGALGYDMLKQHRPIWKSALTIREHLFKYLKSNERLKIAVEDNFQVVNDGQVIEEAFLE